MHLLDINVTDCKMAEFLHRYIVAAFLSTFVLILLTILIALHLYYRCEEHSAERKEEIIEELEEIQNILQYE